MESGERPRGRSPAAHRSIWGPVSSAGDEEAGLM
jgi:hypothetical protein